MSTLSSTLGGKEGMKSPQEVSLNAVNTVLGKGDMLVHLRSGYRQKNIPEYFEFSPVSPEILPAELAKFKSKPKVFFGARDAASFIRDNSLFVTDTYVLNPPGTEMFFVYQFGNIRFFQDQFLRDIGKRSKMLEILENPKSKKGPWDDLGIRISEWVGFDDDGRPLPKLNQIEPILPTDGDRLYTGTYGMGGKEDFKNISSLENLKKPR